MKSRTRVAETRWTLDGDTLTVFIPMTWKRRGGQKVIIAPDGGDAWAPAKARQNETLIRALARTHRWKRMIQSTGLWIFFRPAKKAGVGASNAFDAYLTGPTPVI